MGCGAFQMRRKLARIRRGCELRDLQRRQSSRTCQQKKARIRHKNRPVPPVTRSSDLVIRESGVCAGAHQPDRKIGVCDSCSEVSRPAQLVSRVGRNSNRLAEASGRFAAARGSLGACQNSLAGPLMLAIHRVLVDHGYAQRSSAEQLHLTELPRLK